MSVEPEELAELQALLASDPGELGLDEPPEMADEATATALLRALGEYQRQAADVESLYEHFEQELTRRLALLAERKAERLAPIVKELERVERWLHGWHLAQVTTDKRGKPQRLTIHLPTGTLKLSHQPPEVEVEDPEALLAWAEDDHDQLIARPPRPPQPPARPDGNAVRSFCTTAIANLPDAPEPGASWEPAPGVRVTIKARKFLATPDI